jgi:hypothetical protein
MKNIAGLRYLSITLLFMIISASPAWSTLIADVRYLRKDIGEGWWEYEYFLKNKSDEPDAYLYYVFFDVSLYTDPSINIKPISAAENWEIDPQLGITTTLTEDDAYFFTKSDNTGLGDIGPGSERSNFIFQFSKEIGDISFVALFWDKDKNQGIEYEYIGTATFVPAPATILLLASGAFGLGILGRKIRK